MQREVLNMNFIASELSWALGYVRGNCILPKYYPWNRLEDKLRYDNFL